MQTPFCLPATQSHFLTALETGDSYRIDIAVPDGPAPDAGWPAVFLLDAAGCFATCVEALARMSRRPDATGVVPMVVIGISPPGRGYDVARRRRDFTSAPPVASGVGAPSEGSGTGGALAFLTFIEHQVSPLVKTIAPVDPERLTLFGHSLAGYFTLWTLAHHPHFFRTYAAISPSVWWDSAGLNEAVAQLRGRAQRRAQGQGRDCRVLICIGEWEDALPPWQQAAPGSADVMERRKKRNMVGSAEAMAGRLAEIMGDERVCYRFLAEEDHASIVSAAIPRMLRMASLA